MLFLRPFELHAHTDSRGNFFLLRKISVSREASHSRGRRSAEAEEIKQCGRTRKGSDTTCDLGPFVDHEPGRVAY